MFLASRYNFTNRNCGAGGHSTRPAARLRSIEGSTKKADSSPGTRRSPGGAGYVTVALAQAGPSRRSGALLGGVGRSSPQQPLVGRRGRRVQALVGRQQPQREGVERERRARQHLHVARVGLQERGARGGRGGAGRGPGRAGTHQEQRRQEDVRHVGVVGGRARQQRVDGPRGGRRGQRAQHPRRQRAHVGRAARLRVPRAPRHLRLPLRQRRQARDAPLGLGLAQRAVLALLEEAVVVVAVVEPLAEPRGRPRRLQRARRLRVAPAREPCASASSRSTDPSARGPRPRTAPVDSILSPFLRNFRRNKSFSFGRCTLVTRLKMFPCNTIIFCVYKFCFYLFQNFK